MSAVNMDDEFHGRDPDDIGPISLGLIDEAVGLLRQATVPRTAAVEATISRVKVEAVIGTLLGTISGSFGRVAHATPGLLGLIDEESHDE